MRRATLSLVLAAVCTLCSAARGQYEPTDKSRLGIGFSVIRPAGVQLKNIKGTWLGPTLDFNLSFDDLDRPQAIVTVGWFGEAGEYPYKANFVPVKASFIKRFSRSARGGWYVGSSLSFYFANYKGYEYDPFTRSQKYVDQEGSLLGIGLVTGIEFGGGWYSEVRYDKVKELGLPTGNSVNFGGMSIVVGSRLAL